jgi:hypothetical protein
MRSSSEREQDRPTEYRGDLTPDVGRRSSNTSADVTGIDGGIVDEWGRRSFPASDPPADW